MKGILNIEIECLKKVSIDYKKIIENCSMFSLVLREEVKLNSSGLDFVKRFDPFLIKIERISQWPGTILTDGLADVFYYRLTQDSLNLLDSLESLLILEAPFSLEDICFYIGNEPFLVTISHEKDLYFHVNECELPLLKQKLAQEGIECESWIPLKT